MKQRRSCQVDTFQKHAMRENCGVPLCFSFASRGPTLFCLCVQIMSSRSVGRSQSLITALLCGLHYLADLNKAKGSRTEMNSIALIQYAANSELSLRRDELSVLTMITQWLSDICSDFWGRAPSMVMTYGAFEMSCPATSRHWTSRWEKTYANMANVREGTSCSHAELSQQQWYTALILEESPKRERSSCPETEFTKLICFATHTLT